MPSGRQEPLRRRFWNFVDKKGPKATDHHGRSIGRCYIWVGYRNKGGYGMIGLEENNRSGKRRSALAHRVRWYLKHGSWPEGHLDHRCRVRACVRLTHLEDVTQIENNQRSPRPRLEKCKRGHDLTDDNVYVRIRKNKSGGEYEARQCKQCAKDRVAANRAARRET